LEALKNERKEKRKEEPITKLNPSKLLGLERNADHTQTIKLFPEGESE
jgi:hypothetical protein